MILNDKGKPLAVLANVIEIVSSDPKLNECFRFDEMERMTVLTHDLFVPMSGNFQRRELKEKDVIAVQEYVQRQGLVRASKDMIRDAISLHAEAHPFHPVQEWLYGLEWDHEPRLNFWLAEYLGADHSECNTVMGAKWLISMVARVMEPGCKADHMIVLEGAQGTLKSTTCEILGHPWFSDALPDIQTNFKDACVHLRGKWLLEIAEMQAFGKAESSQLKSFISRLEERFRPPYGRLEVIEPRQCVFIGTTNNGTYLKDETGGRRFWPVRCGEIQREALERDRDQLFAEAFARYQTGEPWWPDAGFEAQHIRPVQHARFETDVWEEPIANYVNGTINTKVTLYEIAKSALDCPTSQMKVADQNRIKRCLIHLGWEPAGREAGTGRAMFSRKS
jgi:predicted P-loop ATPase